MGCLRPDARIDILHEVRYVDVQPSGVLVHPMSNGEEVEMNLCAILGQSSMALVSGDLLGEPLMIWETLQKPRSSGTHEAARLGATFPSFPRREALFAGQETARVGTDSEIPSGTSRE